MSSIANFATLVVNDPDFTRFAAKPRDALWSQLFTIPIGFAITSFIGIIVSSSSVVIYPGSEPIWDPLKLLERFIDDGGSAQRFGVFVIAAAFALAQLGTNIAANSVSAGTDMTALLPRFINIRRGGYICAVVGLAMCPYTLLTDSNQFTTYLSAYSVFLSSIAGVMCCDYYFVRKGYLEVKELYDARKSGPYFFTFGINWRAYAAYIGGILINVVGFAGAVGRDVPAGATYVVSRPIHLFILTTPLLSLAFAYKAFSLILTSSADSLCHRVSTGSSAACFLSLPQVVTGWRWVTLSRTCDLHTMAAVRRNLTKRRLRVATMGRTPNLSKSYTRNNSFRYDHSHAPGEEYGMVLECTLRCGQSIKFLVQPDFAYHHVTVPTNVQRVSSAATDQ